MTHSPALTAAGAPVLAMVKSTGTSAPSWARVGSSSRLLAGFGSTVALATVAELVRVAETARSASTRTSISTKATPPAGITPNWQTTRSLPGAVSAQPGLAPTKVTLTGSVSVTTTFWASDGPLLVTTIWYGSTSPAKTGSTRSRLAMPRSAAVSTCAVTDEKLLPVCGSCWSADAWAVLARLLPQSPH